MNSNSRFIKSIIQTAQAAEVEMPWARGKRREVFIAKRAKQERMRKSA